MDTTGSTEPSDIELAARLEDGDVSAFRSLYDRHIAYVTAVSTRILGEHDEAEEVAQDIFWRLWKGAIRYEPERGRFVTWLFSIARSRSIDRLRGRARRDRTREELAQANPVYEASNPAAASEQHQRVRAAVAELPPEQREALGLCFFRGLSHREAAERIGAPLGTVKSRIKLAVSKLRTSLADLEEGL